MNTGMETTKNNFGGLLVGFVLPAVQALTTGLLSFLFAWPISSVMWEYAEHNDFALFGTPLLFAVTVGAGVSLMMWLNLRQRWHDALEIMLGVDLNRDGVIGNVQTQEDFEPQQNEVPSMSVYVHEGTQTKVLKVPQIDHERLVEVAKTLLDRGTFGYADFSGPGRPLNRPEFELLRSEFISRGILFKGPGKSTSPVLTAAGRAVMRAIIEEEVIPPMPSYAVSRT